MLTMVALLGSAAIPVVDAAETEGSNDTGMESQSVNNEALVRGQVLRLESDHFYVVKDQSGKEIHLMVMPDMMPSNGAIKAGDRIEAKVDNDGRVMNIRQDGGSGQ
jgi:hypothetical protein